MIEVIVDNLFQIIFYYISPNFPSFKTISRQTKIYGKEFKKIKSNQARKNNFV